MRCTKMFCTRMRCVVGGLCIAALLAPSAARAQSKTTTLTVSATTVTFAAPAATDYVAGYLYAAPNITATVRATGGVVNDRNSLLYIRTSSANLGGSKPVSDLEYKCTTGPTWTQMTTTNVLIAQNRIGFGGPSNPWSCIVQFRIKLTWASDLTGATFAATVVTTLTTTTP
ncbi:MAG TPA: hypothetical protein VII66_00730 [Gemmatimonadaceae bacterium]